MGNELQPDHCPHCGTAFEIVSVKFRLTRAATLAACPNCAVAVAVDLRGAGFKTPPRSERFAKGLRQTRSSSMDPLNIRFRYILAFLFGAVIAAAALRHGFHVYAGFSRGEIREDALLAIPFVVLAVIILRRKRQR
jgi:hypothetical protein